MIKLSESEVLKLRLEKFDNEDKLQSASFSLILRVAPELLGKVFHPKNEQNFGLKDRANDPRLPRKHGETDKAYFARLGAFYGGKEKAKGVVPGIPDLCFKLNGIFFSIELKIEKVGSNLSDDQLEIHRIWNEDYEFIQVFVCRNLLEVYRSVVWIMECDFRVYSKKYVDELYVKVRCLENLVEVYNMHRDYKDELEKFKNANK